LLLIDGKTATSEAPILAPSRIRPQLPTVDGMGKFPDMMENWRGMDGSYEPTLLSMAL
jgi:hypothetical protein